MKKLLFVIISMILLLGCGSTGAPDSIESISEEDSILLYGEWVVNPTDSEIEEAIAYEEAKSEEMLLLHEDWTEEDEYYEETGEELEPLAVEIEKDSTLAVEMYALLVEESKEEPMKEEPMDEELTLIHDHDLPPNALIFPHHETGYDWQSSDTTLEESIWVGIVVSNRPNKLGNYSYTVYMTSNTLLNDTTIANVVVGGIDILYFSPEEYLSNRSNDKRTLQSKEDFKNQITKEVEQQEPEHLFNELHEWKSPTLIVTHEQILVHTFYLPDTESEIVVMWEYIKKIEKK